MSLPTTTRAALLVGALAIFVAGCPDTNENPYVEDDAGLPDAGELLPDAGDGNDGNDGGFTDDCVELTPGRQDFQVNLFGQITGVRFPVSPNLDEAQGETLLVELYDSSTPDLPPLQTGTFPLGAPPNDSLLTCQHCVWMPLDWDGASSISRLFVASEGQLTLTQVSDPLESIFAGTVSGLVMREAQVTEEGDLTFVVGGRCARVPVLEFDTSPTTGKPCLSAEDCGNPLLEICSPETNRCAPHECGEDQGCPSDRPVCVTQYSTMSVGACYAHCDPTEPLPCGNGRSCVQMGVLPTEGICLLDGDAALGGVCQREDTSTSCLGGMTCSGITSTCTNTCGYFTSAPGCQAGHACTVLGVCDPESSGDAADFGEPCDETAQMAQGCASDGSKFLGICFGFDPTVPMTCERACLGDAGCGSNEFCALRFSSGLGICRPMPVCGDGERGEINEICDDGNTTSGDGCSADCQTVEYGPICGGAALLQPGVTTGDTRTAWDGFMASCQLGLARTEVYRYDPPARGRLRLTLESDKSHSVSLRTVCADEASELSCTMIEPFSGTELIHQVTDPGELSVLVSAVTVIEEGPWTLHTEFTPELCGDGIIAGLETCDDGNTVSNDGCSGDCNTIEYAVFCGQAPALVVGTPSTGDNTGAVSNFETSCTGSVLGSGPDRLFTFTATTTGNVRFRLEPDAASFADLVLAVFDGCGEPAMMTELGCSSVYDIEEVTVPVTAGRTLTVLVEGFHPHSVSQFTISAEMVP